MSDNSKANNDSQNSIRENDENINQESTKQDYISDETELDQSFQDQDQFEEEFADEALEEGVLERVLLKMGVVGELLLLFVKGDRWWMAPLVLLLCVLGAVLVVLNSLEYVAPFIYMAF